MSPIPSMPVSQRVVQVCLFLVAVMILPAGTIAESTVKPGIQAPVQPRAVPPQQIQMDPALQLRMELARMQQQIETMRQELQRTSQALDTLKRQYAAHSHGVLGSAIPISQFADEAARNYRNVSVSVSVGLLQTSPPRN